jgi:hypothetical protein
MASFPEIQVTTVQTPTAAGFGAKIPALAQRVGSTYETSGRL